MQRKNEHQQHKHNKPGRQKQKSKAKKNRIGNIKPKPTVSAPEKKATHEYYKSNSIQKLQSLIYTCKQSILVITGCVSVESSLTRKRKRATRIADMKNLGAQTCERRMREKEMGPRNMGFALPVSTRNYFASIQNLKPSMFDPTAKKHSALGLAQESPAAQKKKE